MNSNTIWLRIAGTIFGIVALIHVLRLVTGVPVLIGNWFLPMWVNWIGLLATGFLFFWLWKLTLNVIFGRRNVMEINFIKRIRPENTPPPEGVPMAQIFEIKDWEDLHYFDDKILLLPTKYVRIFHRRRKDEGFQAKKGIIKIINPVNKREIYRQYYGQSGIRDNEAGLTSLSMNELGITSGDVELKIKGTRLFVGRMYFLWNHPDIIVRVPAKIAVISTL